MKKSIKILSLVLALALICGALVIGVFAKTAAEYEGVEGVTVMEAADFENADTTIDVKGTDGTSNKTTTIGSMAADIINRHGRLQVVSSEYEENIYVTYTPGYVQKSTGGPFISNGYGAGNTAGIYEKSGMLNNRYQVMDFDIYFPAGRSIYYVNPAWQIRYLNASGGNGYNTGSEKGNIGFIIYSDDTADSGIYVQDNNVANWSSNAVKVPLSATEWNHITYIIEMTDAWALADGTACAEGDEGAIAVLEFTGYIIVNDVIASKYTYGNSISFLKYTDASKFKSGDIRDMVFSEWRTGFQDNSTKTYNKDAVIAFDNMSWRSINTGKYAKTAELQAALGTGVGGSLATWTDSIYDEATMPFGTLAATIGEGDAIQYFDDLAKAVAAAGENDVITLAANSTKEVVINKPVNIAKNGFTANLVPLNGGVKITETADAYTSEVTDVKMTVRVQPCECGEGCFEAKTIDVYKGEVIWDAIVREYGEEITCSYTVDGTKYDFDGFIVTDTAASFFDGGKFDKTTVVTDAFNGTVAVISVAYKVTAPTSVVYTSSGNVVKYFYAGDTFVSALSIMSGANGRVLKLLADHTTDESDTKYLETSATLDLNGYTIKHLCLPNATNKKNGGSTELTKALVQVKATGNLTFTSSVVGGKVFEAACIYNSTTYSTPFLSGNGNGATINIIGQVNGETTLSFYGANVVQSYGSRTSVNVDGGFYCRNRSDSYAMFDMRVLGDCSFRNATMDGHNGSNAAFAFSGRNSGMGNTTATITVDNCNIINGQVLNYASDKIHVTFTNSVIGGNINPTVESSATALDGNEIYIGLGCKIKNGVTFSEKVNIVGDTVGSNEVLKYNVVKNTWNKLNDNTTYALSTSTITVNVDKVVVDLARAEFMYVSGGKTMAAFPEDNMTLQAIINKSDAGSTITFKKDVEIETTYNCAVSNTDPTTSDAVNNNKCNNVAVIGKDITFDLNGHKLQILGTTTSAQPTIYISQSNVDFTIRNGTVITGYTVKNQNTYQAYALVQARGGMTLTLDNCKFYGSAITYSYDAPNCTVNVSNSEVHLNALTRGANDYGFINGRRYFDATITDTKFYITYSTASLVSVSAGGLGEKDHGEIVFNNCDIVSTTGNRIVRQSSPYQDIIFNNCRISGYLGAPVINTTLEKLESDEEPKITLGEGTVFNSYADGGFEEGGALEVPEGFVKYSQESSYIISLYASSGQFADGNFTLPDFSGEPNSNETYTFRHVIVDASTLTSFNVNWYDQNGELISSEQVFSDTEVVPPAFTPTVITANGWWRQMYDSWSNTQGGEVTENFLITEDRDYYIVAGTPKPYLTAAQFNLTLNGHIVMNFYLPNDIPEGITVTSVGGDIQYKSHSNIDLGGKNYTSYIASYVGVSNMVNDTTVVVNFTVEVGGETYELTQNIKISPYRYAKSVLADYDNYVATGVNKYDVKAYTIVANMLRYAKVVCNYNGMAGSNVGGLLAPYEEALCTPIDSADDSDFPASNMVDLGDLKDYIQSVTFEVSTYEPRYKVTFKPGSKVVDFHLEAIGYNRTTNGLDMGGINWGYQTYTYSTGYGVYYYDSLGQFVNPSGTVVNEYGSKISGATAGEWASTKYLGSVHTQNIPIYNVDEDMTIVITLEDGTIVKGEYNIDTYYNNIKNAKDGEGNNKYTAEQITEIRTFFRAMRNYAKAVENYRFPVGKYPYVDENKIGENGQPVVNATLFGATPNDGKDDYAALKATFEFANKMGYDVVFPSGEYTIGIDTNGAIPVKTNVDFGNATFDIQDNLYTEANTPSASNTSTISTYGNDIFQVQSDYKYSSITTNLPASISAGATNIGYAPGFTAHVKIYNSNAYNYIRHGTNNADVEDQIKTYEIVLVDADGNVDPSTPILFDYTTVTKLVVRRADDTPIKLEGGTFVTNANQMYREYRYVSRGISVERSNTTLEGIDHEIINEGSTGAPYSGFFYVRNCNNVLIKDCTVQAHKYYTRAQDENNNMGTYDIGAESASNLTYDGVVQSNFWYEGQVGGYVSNTTYGGVWGIAGSNDCKNMWYKNCQVARYDAHRGVVNGGIENSTLSGVSILGGGTFYFRNNKVYSNTTQYIINLREDYGSSWKGEMIFENIDWTCAANATLSSVDLYVVSATKTTDHHFGYACYAPNLTFNGTFKVTLTGKKYSGLGGTVSLGTLYAGKIATGSTSSGCNGCDDSVYGVANSTYVKDDNHGKITVNSTGATIKNSWVT